MKRDEVEWADGIVTRLTQLNQSGTYARLLEGVPTQMMNDHFLLRPLSAAHKSYAGEPLILWAPQTPGETQADETVEMYMSSPVSFLPAVTCIATFQHFRPARDKEQHYSYVTVAWFQEEWPFPIVDEVLSKIKSLAWRDIAFDVDW